MAARLAGVLADGRRTQGVGGALRLTPPEVVAHLGGHRNLHRRAEQAAEELRSQHCRAGERRIRYIRRRRDAGMPRPPAHAGT